MVWCLRARLLNLLCPVVFLYAPIATRYSSKADGYERRNVRPLSTRVVNGTVGEHCKWPWMAQVRFRPADPGSDAPASIESIPLCAGVLFDTDTVITAAHCLQLNTHIPVQFNVVLGEFDTRVNESTEMIIDVNHYFIHPRFNTEHVLHQATSNFIYDDDIAVIKLKERQKYNSCISPANLKENGPDTIVGTHCKIAGWGKVSDKEMQYPVMMVGDVRLINREVCSDSLQSTGVHLPQNAICSSSDSNVDSCHGDDGGMLVCADADGKWLLLGIIISHGCHGVDPTIYVNVSAYSEWIKKPDAQISSPIVG